MILRNTSTTSKAPASSFLRQRVEASTPMKGNACAYCGAVGARLEREHVFPKCLYPPSSRARSNVQLLTVPACAKCNSSWTDDEAHFRDMLTISGEPNAVVLENWETVLRSFSKVDGQHRRRELAEHMRPVSIDGQLRHRVFPGKDDKVRRILRKIVRGLCYHHKLLTPVSDRRISADVQKYAIPAAFRDSMIAQHRERDVAEYSYERIGSHGIHSVFVLTFFENRSFFALVSESEQGFEGV